MMLQGVSQLLKRSADMVARQADVIAALSLDVLQGTPRAFDYGQSKPQYDLARTRPRIGCCKLY